MRKDIGRNSRVGFLAAGILMAGALTAGRGTAWGAFSFPGCADLAATDFKAVKLVVRSDGIAEPLKMALDGDASGNVDVYWVERVGDVKRYSAVSKKIDLLGTLDADSKYESGLSGIALDPGFKTNNWIYFYYASGNQTKFSFRVSRFTLNKTTSALDMASEKIMLDIPAGYSKQHTGGALRFDGAGDLWITVGENQGGLDGPANTNDLRGKILHIHPTPDGAYTIPSGNLFPPGTPKTKPEIFVMGCRNPYTLSIDPLRKGIAWGDVGPDHQLDHEEHNFTTTPGFYGWPLFAGQNLPLMTGYNAAAPVVVNSGVSPLPPATPAIYTYHQSAAMTGPFYYYDQNSPSKIKLPPHLNGTWFVSDFDANWIEGVTLDAKGQSIVKKERLWTTIFGSTVKLPIDMQIGPDGAFYVIAYSGGSWFAADAGTSIVRIEYTGTCLPTSGVTNALIRVPESQVLRFSGRDVSIAVEGPHAVTVRDIAGRSVFSRAGQGHATYALGAIGKPGVYFLTAVTAQGTVSRKFIVD